MSVWMLGHDVSFRPRTTSASTSIHGPWQITPTGLPGSKNSRTNWTASSSHPHRVRVADAARDHERVVVVDARVLDGAVDLERVGLVVVVEALDLALLERDQLRRAAGLLDRLPRLRQLDLLDHVGGEERNALALQLVSHEKPLSLVRARLGSRWPGGGGGSSSTYCSAPPAGR